MNKTDSLALNDPMVSMYLDTSDSAGNPSIGRTDLNKNTLEHRYNNHTYQNVYPYVEKFYPQQYTTYWNTWKEDSKLEKAFRLAQKLMEKKFIKEPKTVKEFIELVNTLSDEL